MKNELDIISEWSECAVLIDPNTFFTSSNQYAYAILCNLVISFRLR